jgi:hypothetical protein
VKLILLLAAIATALPTFAQSIEHAPTKDVCQADVAVWYSHAWINERVPNRTATSKLLVGVATARMNEMYACMSVDPEQSDRYKAAGDMYYDVFTDRALGFISRHNLMGQLKKEDAEGMR